MSGSRPILVILGILFVLSLLPLPGPPEAAAARQGVRRSAVDPSHAASATPGAQLWASRYNGPGSGFDSASAVAVSPDGSKVYVTGNSARATSGNDYATEAIDASSGAKLWVSRYNGTGNGDDEAHALAVSPDGATVFVTGTSRGSASNFDYATLGIDASTGAKLWVERYAGPGGDDGSVALGVSPDGATVFVTGFSRGTATGNDYATEALDAFTGTMLWVSRYNGAGGDDDPRALAVSSDGSEVFVTGDTLGVISASEYATVAMDASTGARLWVSRYRGQWGAGDYAAALGVSSDGSTVFVTGSNMDLTYPHYPTVAIDASTGAKLWVSLYNGPGGEDSASALGVSPDGSMVFVTGESYGGRSGEDYATVALDASTGAKRWVSRYNGGLTDSPSALGLSPDGATVFVTGYSYGSASGQDYATVAIDASTGAKLWVERYTGPSGDDSARAMAISPDGSMIFVTGFSYGSTSGFDYATVAYSTR